MNGRPGVIVQVSSAKQFVGQDVLDVTELMKRIKSVGLSGEPREGKLFAHDRLARREMVE